MRDPEEPLRTAYFQALQGKISLDGVSIPVFVKGVPSTVNGAYISIYGVTMVGLNRGPACRGFTCTVSLDIVTTWDNNAYKPSLASRIGALVMEYTEEKYLSAKINETLTVIADDTADILVFQPLAAFNNLNYAWQIESHALEFSDSSLLEQGPDKVYDRRLLRFRDVVIEQ